MARLAIFDIDETLVHPSTGVHLAKGLKAQGIVGLWEVMLGVVFHTLMRLRCMSYSALIKSGMQVVEGRSVEEVTGWFEKVYEDRIRSSFMVDSTRKLFEHLEQGDRVVLISATPALLGQFVANALGVELFACAELETGEGRILNGVVDPVPYGIGKVPHAERLAQEAGLSLEDAYFYTDSSSDLPLLEKVGHPVAVNPDPFLRRTALKRGWPIMDGVHTEDLRAIKKKPGSSG